MKKLIFGLLIIGTPISAFPASKELDSAVQSIAQQLTKDLKTTGESIAILPFLTLDNKTTCSAS